jgi:hypothetical protein
MVFDNEGMDYPEDPALTPDERAKTYGIWSDAVVESDPDLNLVNVVLDKPLPGRSKVVATVDSAEAAAWIFQALATALVESAKTIGPFKI